MDTLKADVPGPDGKTHSITFTVIYGNKSTSVVRTFTINKPWQKPIQVDPITIQIIAVIVLMIIIFLLLLLHFESQWRRRLEKKINTKESEINHH